MSHRNGPSTHPEGDGTFSLDIRALVHVKVVDMSNSHDRRVLRRAVERKIKELVPAPTPIPTPAAISQIPSSAYPLSGAHAAPKKPIDLWLTIAGVVVTVVLYLLPRTPTVIVICLAFIFGLLCHPVWNFWWIEKTITRKLVALGSLAIAIGTIGAMVKPESQRLYNLTEGRRIKLKSLLQQKEPRATLRIGCVTWSDTACVAAGEFLMVFSEAGWKIDSAKVFRMEAQIPMAGVAIVTRPEPGAEKLPPLPPHLGRWSKMTPSEITTWRALRELDIPIRGSIETDLPDGTMGVYFGPEPQQPSPMLPSEREAFQNVVRPQK